MKEQKQNQHSVYRFKRWTRCRFAIFASIKRQVCIGVLSLSCSILSLKAQSNMPSTSVETILSALEQKTEKEVILELDSVTDALMVTQLSEVNVRGKKQIPLLPMVNNLSELSFLDIEQAGVQNLQDLLRYMKGVDIRSRGGENVQADLNLRGGTFDQSIVLLDGVNLTDPQTGHHSLNVPIPFIGINKMELYQGAGAWIYGVSPFTAALNIIPRPLGSSYLKLSASGGMYGYYQTEVHGQYSKGPWSIAADAGYTASDGYIDNTDFDIINALLRLGYSKPEGFGTIKLSLGFQQKNFGAQSFYSTKYKEQYEKTKAFLAILQYKKVVGRWRIEAQSYWRQHYDQFDLFRYISTAPQWYTGPNHHRTDVIGVGVKTAYAWNQGGTTMFGADYRYEHIYSNNIGVLLPDLVDSASASSPSKIYNGVKVPFVDGYYYNRSALRQVGSGFVQHTYKSNNEKWKIAAGLLINGSSDFGAFVFGGASLSYKWTQNWSYDIFLNHSYRAPTFTDLYYKSANQTSNIDLEPEQAITAETSVKWKKSGFNAMAGLFYRYGFRIIDWVKLEGDDMWYSKNLTKLHTIGAEMSFSYSPQIEYLEKIGFDYTYLYTTKKSENYQSLYATDYLRNSFKFYINHKIYNSLGASWELIVNDRAGNYTDELGGNKSYKPYALCNLRLYWSRPKYEIFVMASNLFNVRYFELGNIGQPGIWVKAGASLKL